MDDNLVVVIMAGGIGTRFWPLSTTRKPKQFLTVFGPRSLLQQTYDRATQCVPPERIFVLTNQEFCGLVREQLPDLPLTNIVGEPVRRDTAGAVALSALLCQKRFGNPVITVLTADHVLEPEKDFLDSLSSAVRQARITNVLYTFGIRPTHPATGYGYLELGERVLDDQGIEHFRLNRFKEKPDLDTAMNYVASGRFVWNSGMFVWTAEAILRELRRHSPQHVEILQPAIEKEGSSAWEGALASSFQSLPTLSIDFAVMEKAEDVRSVAASFSWKDLGGWLSVESAMEKDDRDNAFRGQLFTIDAHANLVFCEDAMDQVALIGVDNLVVIRAGRTTLIVPKGRTEEVKAMVRKIEES